MIIKNIAKFLLLVLLSFIINILLLLYSTRYDLRGWIDSTFATGVLFTGIGTLIVISSEGIFNIAIYGTKKFLLFIFNRTHSMESYIDYYEEKQSREKVSVSKIIYVGILQLIVSFILLYIYYQ